MFEEGDMILVEGFSRGDCVTLTLRVEQAAWSELGLGALSSLSAEEKETLCY